MADTQAVDVTEATFQQEVLDRSHEVPVVVDFWADWCGPCRILGPVLEEAVAARGGEVVLAKVDVDANQRLSSSFRIQGIPAVKAFRDGEVVAEFVGAQGRPQVEAFLDRIVPTEADRLAGRGLRLLSQGGTTEAAAAFRQALEADPKHRAAAVELARMIVDEHPDEALELLAPHRPDPAAEQVAAQAELSGATGDLDALRERVDGDPTDAGVRLEYARALASAGDHDAAIEELLVVVRAGGETRDLAREQLLRLFDLLGPDDPRVAAARRELASALF